MAVDINSTEVEAVWLESSYKTTQAPRKIPERTAARLVTTGVIGGREPRAALLVPLWRSCQQRAYAY